MLLNDAVKRIYAEHSAGCCWHIVLDDGNVEPSSIDLCFKTALEEKHKDCIAVGLCLRALGAVLTDGELEQAVALATGDIT